MARDDPKLSLPDEVVGLRRQWTVQRHVVGRRQQVVQGYGSATEGLDVGRLDHRVMRQQGHVESP